MYAQEIEKYILKWQAVSLLTFDVPGKKRISDAYKKLIIELQENVKVKFFNFLLYLFYIVIYLSFKQHYADKYNIYSVLHNV